MIQLYASDQGPNMPIHYRNNRKVDNSPSRKCGRYTKCYKI